MHACQFVISHKRTSCSSDFDGCASNKLQSKPHISCQALQVACTQGPVKPQTRHLSVVDNAYNCSAVRARLEAAESRLSSNLAAMEGHGGDHATPTTVERVMANRTNVVGGERRTGCMAVEDVSAGDLTKRRLAMELS